METPHAAEEDRGVAASRPPRLRRGHRASTWIGYAVGIAAVPALLLAHARAMTALYGGVTADSAYAVALATTRDMADAVDRYRSRHQHVPEPREGLAALVPDFVAAVPVDPWGNPYVYETSDPTFADVLSHGADGKPGGSGLGADVSGRYGHKFGSRPPAPVDFLATLGLFCLPLLAWLGARRWTWAAGVLAGTGTLWGFVLLAARTSAAPASLATWTLSVICLTGSVASLRGLPGARTLTCGATLLASVVAQQLFTVG